MRAIFWIILVGTGMLSRISAAQTGVSSSDAPAIDEGPSPPASEAPAPPSEEAPADFIAGARALMRVVACREGEALPEGVDPKTVERHCKEFAPKLDFYRKNYVVKAQKFLSTLRTPDLPRTVVYPFGGGDLLSALTTYPEAEKIITISLERGGDPRGISGLSRRRLAEILVKIRRGAWGLLRADNSTSENLINLEGLELPGELCFFLLALAIHDLEPVHLRYFGIGSDGAIHYFTPTDLAELAERKAPRLHYKWKNYRGSVAFSNLELGFRRKDDPPGMVRVHQHIAANLKDDFLKTDPSLLRYLETLGPVSAMTKAASYCLANPAFSMIRNYLLAHMAILISDSSGIPPRYYKKLPFTLEAYGDFEFSLLKLRPELNEELKKFFRKQKRRPLPFRYGYPDGRGVFHMMVARRQPAAPPDAPAPTSPAPEH
jgi:hypothetical protein